MKLRNALIALTAVPVLVLPSAAVAAGGSPASTDLSGSEEAPGPGDADATGFANLSLNQGKGRVCFDLEWADIDGTVTAAHLHEAPAGKAGGVVVTLFSGSFEGTASASACVVGLERSLVKEIRKNPEDYYVNVHSDVFPAGAVRGQLG